MEGNPALTNLLRLGGRLVLGGTFAYAAIAKLADPAAFAADIAHFHLLPYPATLLLGVYLPWLELVCAAAILLRRRERAALVLTLGLCALFAGALASAWHRGLDLSCGCFGHDAAASHLPFALARAIALGLIAALLLRFRGDGPLRPTL